ncbi:MAG TPA: Mpo1-like protein [Alphaproteobacteria bacterium]|jgi:uncharacterized membrane protein YGL010W
MTDFRFFERQMAMYTTYHRDWRNRLTHVFGVPAIIFGLLVAMGMWRWHIGGYDLSFGVAFALAVFVLWLVLDVGLALPLIVLLVPVLVLAEYIAREAPALTAWTVVAVFFVGGWVLQLLGHVYEGRKPALVENLFQIFVAPMFLVAELLFALGLRQKLHGRIEACIRAHFPDFAQETAGPDAVRRV